MQISSPETRRTQSRGKLRKIGCLGGGTYSRVYQAINDDDLVQPTAGSLIFVETSYPQSQLFAVKRNFVSQNLSGSVGSVRELDLLNLVKDHPYCISLREASFGSPFHDGSLSPSRDPRWVSDKLFFILEKGELDGTKYITRMSKPSLRGGLVNERKLFMVQVLLAVEFIHSRGIYPVSYTH